MESLKSSPLPYWLRLLSFLSLGIILPWPVIISLSGFLFDAPNAGKHFSTWFMAFVSWFYPLIVIGIVGTGRQIFLQNKPAGSFVVSIPLITLVCLIYAYDNHRDDARWGLFTYEDQTEKQLIKAVTQGDLEAINRLWVNTDINLDAVSSRGNTPLIAAYKEDQEAAFRLLIELGANVNFKPHGNLSNSIAGYIIRDQFTDDDVKKVRYFRILMQGGLDPHLADHNRSLIYLSASANTNLMQVLMQEGADYNQETHWGTPLIAALHSRNWESAILLLSQPLVFINTDTIDAFNSSVHDNRLINIPEGRKKVYDILLHEKGITESHLLTNQISKNLNW